MVQVRRSALEQLKRERGRGRWRGGWGGGGGEGAEGRMRVEAGIVGHRTRYSVHRTSTGPRTEPAGREERPSALLSTVGRTREAMGGLTTARQAGAMGPDATRSAYWTRTVHEAPLQSRQDDEEGGGRTALDALLVHDSAPALAAANGFARLDLVRRSAVCGARTTRERAPEGLCQLVDGRRKVAGAVKVGEAVEAGTHRRTSTLRRRQRHHRGGRAGPDRSS